MYHVWTIITPQNCTTKYGDYSCSPKKNNNNFPINVGLPSLWKNKKMKLVVPDITLNSSFRDLTLSLMYSFQETEQKIVEDILTTRENALKDEIKILDEKLKEEVGFAAQLKYKVENLVQSRVEFEEKVKEKWVVLEKVGELKRKVLEEEVESLKWKCEDLERDHDMMKKNVSLYVLEKLELEKEVEKSVMENEEGRKELEKMRIFYEEELKKERDLRENKLILAELERMDLEEELKKCRKGFEEEIQVLEVKNLELNKKVEQHMESFFKIRNFAELIKGVYDSAISGNVRGVNEVLSNGLDACEKASNVDGRVTEYPVSSGEPLPKTPLQTEVKCLRGKQTGIQLGESSGCLFLENELEDGGHNENNYSLKSKRRRSINESEDEGIGLCSANSRESHVISSKNKEVAGCQIGKEITWRQSADMLLALRNDPELCMASVSALYRRYISGGNPSNSGVLSEIDIVSTTAVAKYLFNNDPANKLSRSVLEVQQDCPYVLQTCWKLANQYKEQIFEIYQKELDPLFCPKS